MHPFFLFFLHFEGETRNMDLDQVQVLQIGTAALTCGGAGVSTMTCDHWSHYYISLPVQGQNPICRKRAGLCFQASSEGPYIYLCVPFLFKWRHPSRYMFNNAHVLYDESIHWPFMSKEKRAWDSYYYGNIRQWTQANIVFSHQATVSFVEQSNNSHVLIFIIRAPGRIG